MLEYRPDELYQRRVARYTNSNKKTTYLNKGEWRRYLQGRLKGATGTDAIPLAIYKDPTIAEFRYLVDADAVAVADAALRRAEEPQPAWLRAYYAGGPHAAEAAIAKEYVLAREAESHGGKIVWRV